MASTSLGQAQGTNAALSGAVQATGQGQTTGQLDRLSSSSQGQKLTGGPDNGDVVVGSLGEQGNNASQQSQRQAQSQGTGAATGSANVAEGTATNVLSSNVNTNNAGGTSVSSNAANTATGKGLHVSGAVSSSGQQQNQGQNLLALNLLQGGMMMGMQQPGRVRREAVNRAVL